MATKIFLALLATGIFFQAHADYAVGDFVHVKSRRDGFECPGLLFETEYVWEVTGRVPNLGWVDLMIHEVGHLNKRYYDSTYKMDGSQLVDWHKLSDSAELQKYCDSKPKDKGIVEWVDVPAGRFLACKFSYVQSVQRNERLYLWYGPVPMGFIKSASVGPHCTDTEELISYKVGAP